MTLALGFPESGHGHYRVIIESSFREYDRAEKKNRGP